MTRGGEAHRGGLWTPVAILVLDTRSGDAPPDRQGYAHVVAYEFVSGMRELRSAQEES